MKSIAVIALCIPWTTGCASPARSPVVEPGDSIPVWIGYRLGVAYGDGDPANDIPIPFGLFGRYEFADSWAVGLGVDLMEGEIQDPPGKLGLAPTSASEAPEALASYTQVGVWVERALWRHGDHTLFGLAGLGAAFVDVDDVSGALQGGGSFDIATDSDVEAVGTLGLGYRIRFGRAWDFEVLGRYEHHAADWEVTDRVSGATRTVDDYGFATVLLGMSYHF